VRQQARISVEPYLVAERRRELVAALPLLLKLRRARRADHGEVVERAAALLTPPDGTAAVWSGLGDDDLEARAAAVRLLLGDDGHLDVDRTALLLIRPEADLRLGAARRLVRLAGAAAAEAKTELEELVATAGRDPIGRVRAAALEAALRLHPDQAEDRLQRALVDRSLEVRRLARAELASRPVEPDGATPAAPARACYLAVLAGFTAPPDDAAGRQALTGALLGLGEIGAPADRAVVVSWLGRLESNGASRPLRAAVRALGLLDGRGFRPELLGALRHPRPRVAREAARALSGQLGPAEQAALLALATDPDAPAHGVGRALGLLAEVDGWTALPALLANLSGPPAIGEPARRALRRWLARQGRRPRPPSTSQQLAARAALALLREERLAAPAPPEPDGEVALVELTLAPWP
jgi:hypothetical protein